MFEMLSGHIRGKLLDAQYGIKQVADKATYEVWRIGYHSPVQIHLPTIEKVEIPKFRLKKTDHETAEIKENDSVEKKTEDKPSVKIKVTIKPVTEEARDEEVSDNGN